MRIDILSCVPSLLESPFSHSILKRSQEKGIAEVILHDIRDYATDKHKKVDDYAFGGEAGMVLMIEPIAKCIRKLQKERKYDEIIYTTPDGVKMEQKLVNQLSMLQNIMIICGHYKGVDQRVRDLFVTKEISIGDYVLSGGELAAAVIVDAIVRLIPNVLSDETSALSDTFQDDLLAPPVYTRPAVFEGLEVPAVLLSGNHDKIAAWRDEMAIKNTQEKRPDLWERHLK
jgi:tRNA (guanine37-N1)-methyltransferase